MNSKKIVFFISYSTSRALRPDAVKLFIELLKDVIVNDLKLEYLDPFETNTPQTIAQQVATSLWDCDCLIAEATNASSNVWFEMGFAEGLGKPLVMFLDKARGDQNLPDIDKTLAEVRSHLFGRNEFPSDIGDRKWFDYELPTGATAAHIAAVRETIKKTLGDTCERLLRRQVVMPRRSMTHAFKEGLNETKNNAHMPHKLWILDGLTKYLIKQYGAVRQQQVKIDETIYRSMLEAMSDSTLRDSSRAVADMSSGIEPYLLKSKIEDVKVEERIFVFANRDAFTFNLERVASDIWAHAQNYQCHIIDKQYVEECASSLNLRMFVKTGSVDVMTTGHAALWYSYSDDDESMVRRRLLTIDDDPQLVRKVETLLDEIKKRAVNVSKLAQSHPEARSDSERYKLLKAAWLKNREIGQWSPSWRGGNVRSYRYYKDYETHIRVWIPDYSRMAETLLDHVTDAVNDFSGDYPISVAEVGPGTGEQTERILQRLYQMGSETNTPMVSDYRLYESATEMLNRIQARGLIRQSGSHWAEKKYQLEDNSEFHIHVYPNNVNFLNGIGRSDNSSIVIGSLVHHYIDVLDSANPDFECFLKALVSHMPKVRHVVLSGVFYQKDVPTQEADWREWMTETTCLSPEAVDDFFKGNGEMLRPFVIDEIKAQVAKLGWEGQFTPTHSHCPFGVLHLRKIDA